MEPVSISPFIPDADVETLGTDETNLLTRRLMTLSRRRRCAMNHMGMSNPFHDRGLDCEVLSWYLNNGYTEENVVQALKSDLTALLENPNRTSKALQERIILTDYFSSSWKLEDYYDYGDINPFIFENRGGTVNLRDTLFDKMSFPERVATVISFDPDVRGHKHQIRYFRCLLVGYSLAHVLSQILEESELEQAVHLLIKDEFALAKGWITTVNHANEIGIDTKNISLDENLLYNKDKVYESAYLMECYRSSSMELFEGGRSNRRLPQQARNFLIMDDIRVVYGEDEIERRVRELAKEISSDYAGEELVIIGILKSSFILVADLVRCLTIPVEVDFVQPPSRIDLELVSSKRLKLRRGFDIDPRGKHVLVVDDVIGNGSTIKFVLDKVKARRPRSIAVCCLLGEKPRKKRLLPHGYKNYTCFELDGIKSSFKKQCFWVGYGRGFDEWYRYLPHIGILQI